MNLARRIGRDDQATIRPARECALDLADVAHVHRGYLHPEQLRHGLNDGKLGVTGPQKGIAKDRHSLHVWCDLPEQLQPFPADAVFDRHKTGGVATRPRQALHVAADNRIGGLYKHDRHGAGHLLQMTQGHTAIGQEDVRCKRDQLRRVSAIAVGIG